MCKFMLQTAIRNSQMRNSLQYSLDGCTVCNLLRLIALQVFFLGSSCGKQHPNAFDLRFLAHGRPGAVLCHWRLDGKRCSSGVQRRATLAISRAHIDTGSARKQFDNLTVPICAAY